MTTIEINQTNNNNNIDIEQPILVKKPRKTRSDKKYIKPVEELTKEEKQERLLKIRKYWRELKQKQKQKLIEEGKLIPKYNTEQKQIKTLNRVVPGL
jgi:hypothetical protein